MKNLYFIIIAVITIWFSGCSPDEEPKVETKPHAFFLQDTVMVSWSGGKTIASVNSTGTEWEIVLDDDQGIVKDISPKNGGSVENTEKFQQINIVCNENNTEKIRTQEIFLINKTNGERVKLVIKQTTFYTPLTITINKEIKYQFVTGFGGMYNPIIWLRNNLITDAEITKLYAPDQLGYNILRLMVYPNEADWAADVEGAKQAQQYGAIIFAAPWDCTDAFAEKITVNGREYKHLKPEHYQDYANHLIKYINYMKANGVNLYAISVQNEPDMEFTYWYPHEVVDFVKEYGDQIRATGVKLMAPEACGMSPEYTDPILNDPEAFEKTDIIAGHLYQGFVRINESSYVKNRHDYIVGLYNKQLAAAGKTWWMTEHLFNDGQDETSPDLWQFQKWSYNMETLAQEIHMCMEGYCSAYVYWYLKRFYGMLGDNDPRSAVASGEVMKNGYILSHYAKYASGMTRIKVDTENPDVKVTAYINDAGDEITLVLLNMTNKHFGIRIPFGEIKEVNVVESTEQKNMEKVASEELDSENGVYFPLSGLSIASARINF